MPIHSGSDILFVPQPPRPGWPSAARPEFTLMPLWRFDVVWLSTFNLILIVRHRRVLRALLLIMILNGVVLAVFGTVQKLSHATGIYFNAIATPQKYFFASFVYHNHWGAFALLMIGAALGMIWHFARRHRARDIYHSPVFAGLVGVLFIAATIPLSGSRSSTILAVAFGLGAFLHWTAHLVNKRRYFRESVVLPLAGGTAVVLLALGAVWAVAHETITARFALTESQIAQMRAQDSIGARALLYRNTWRMGMDKPWFGWGMGSYPHVFMLYNTQQSVDRLPVFYHDAHSDWLQSFAEHGLIGSVLLALCAVVPLLGTSRRHLGQSIPSYLLAGCGIILLYAWVEFPFGNFAVVLAWWACFFSAVQYARLGDRDSTPTAP